ncbi:hypothetical protein OROGR_014672 [Orobanche gracilis]
MAAMKLFVFTVFLSTVLAGVVVEADASISGVDSEPRSDGLDLSFLEQLKSKIQSLEYRIEEKTREIKDKDVVIAAKEKLIKEKSESIMSMENENPSLQNKGNPDASEQLGKAHARAGELEKQVEKLKKDLEVKIKEKEQLEDRTTEAEKKTSDLNTKVDIIKKIIDDQQTKLRKMERALQIAEEEMMKAKYEVASKTKELMEVHGAWFPPWFAAHLIHYQSLLKTNWNMHGKPVLDLLMQKANEKKARAEEWAAPHVETMRLKWVPAVKEKWITITSNVKPHLQKLSTKTIEIYEATMNAMCPHIFKVMGLVDPYFQELRKISNPYIDQIATVARPHVDTLRVALKPYMQTAVHGCGKFLETAKVCHLQIQEKVQKKLKSHELTESLATKELVWFSASALLALPVIFLMKLCSAAFCKKVRNPTRDGIASRRRVRHGIGRVD